RSYEGIDQSKTDEVARKVNESLLSRLNKLPGFNGYFLFEAGNGAMTSISLFETSAQADESTRVVAHWVRDEKLDTALPNSPKIVTGKVVAHETNGSVRPKRAAVLLTEEGLRLRAFFRFGYSRSPPAVCLSGSGGSTK